MNILVLLKQTFHTEEKIRIEDNRIVEDGAEFVINPYDEYAVEEAVKVKEELGGEITVITLGLPRAESALRTALAMGVDKAVLIDSESVDFGLDEYTASLIISSEVKRHSFDIILCGHTAIDGGSAQTGPRVAELLGIPCITAVTKLEIRDGKITVEKDVEGDIETIESAAPILLTTQQGLNEPRYPSMVGIVKAKKKPVEFISISNLQMEGNSFEAKTEVAEIYLPEQKAVGKVLSGSLNEQLKELVNALCNEAKVV